MIPTRRHSEKGKTKEPINQSAAARGEGDGGGGHRGINFQGSEKSPHSTVMEDGCSVAKLCPALCEPMDHSPPGSPAHGALQARIPE